MPSIVVEGKAKILLNSTFYNPRMEFCRDLDMLVFQHFKSRELLDAMAGTGIRGIRTKLEAGYETVVFNDRSKSAVETIKENLRLNGLTAEVYCKDACILMRERRFEHVDVDPFGSPAKFVDSACFCAKKYLSVTATDTAALCGSAVGAGLRKYSTYLVKTDVFHETGIRNLIGFIVKNATKYDKVPVPIFSFIKEHYYRVYFEIRKSKSLASKIYSQIGFLFYCPYCHSKQIAGNEGGFSKCRCGGTCVILGPIWLGKLKSDKFVSGVERSAEGKLKNFIQKIKNEVDSPTVYNLRHISSKLKIDVPKTSFVVGKLRDEGYEASPTHYCGYCVKTNASLEQIINVLSDQI